MEKKLVQQLKENKMEEEIELAKEEMEKGIASLRNNLSTLRTGRASVSMLDNIQVEYYGDMIALNQIASVTIPEARQLLIKPYDKNDAKAIVAALNASNLGITPINDGNVIRLNIPALTEERRRDIAKTAKKYSEEGKVVIRNARRDCLDMIKNAEYPEDLEKKLQADVQKLTDEYCKKIDDEYASKEKEIMTI
jgi:ribosome recycling factor